MTTHPPTETVRTKYGNCPKCGYEFMGENEARDFGCGMCGYNPPTETKDKDSLFSKEVLNRQHEFGLWAAGKHSPKVEPTVEEWYNKLFIRDSNSTPLGYWLIREEDVAKLKKSLQEAKAEGYREVEHNYFTHGISVDGQHIATNAGGGGGSTLTTKEEE